MRSRYLRSLKEADYWEIDHNNGTGFETKVDGTKVRLLAIWGVNSVFVKTPVDRRKCDKVAMTTLQVNCSSCYMFCGCINLVSRTIYLNKNL